MKWKINSKIKWDYGHLEEKVIPTKGLNHKNWSKSRKDLKDYIRKHYSIVQDGTCAFCREKINIDGYGDHLEHIVAKVHKPNWMYHPKNLCLSCFGCNVSKGDQETIGGNDGHKRFKNLYSQYPLNKSDYIIYHPHLDIYSNEIDTSSIVYISKNGSRKGAKTINICNLNRMSLLYKRAKRKQKSSMIQLQIKTLLNSSATLAQIKIAQAFINEILERNNYIKKLQKKK